MFDGLNVTKTKHKHSDRMDASKTFNPNLLWFVAFNKYNQNVRQKSCADLRCSLW